MRPWPDAGHRSICPNSVFRGSPVPIPDPDDGPAIGHWTADEAAGVAAALRAAAPVPSTDRGLVDTMALVRAWTEAAVARPGFGLVGFLS